ncbi:MAG: efflux RND transporter periplasmic adaptor subunit [Paracoccaceae bacterium]
MRLTQVAATLFALACLASPALAEGESNEAAQEQILPAITVSTVSLQLLRDEIVASGLVSAVEQVNVAPLIEGQQIEALLADVGDEVVAGQVLARLSRSSLDLQKSQLNASLAAARATIAQAEAQRTQAQSAADEAQRANERTIALKAAGNASQAAADKANAGAITATAQLAVAVQSLEASKANLALVEAQLANVDLQLSRTEVKAPFAGEITDRNATLGAIASAAGQPMFILMRDSALELRADISESDLMRVQPGQPAALRLSSSLDPVPGSVRLVEPTIDSGTRLGRIRIAITDKTMVRAGMFVEATILVAERTAIAVPVTALGSHQGQAAVMVIEDGTAKRRLVTIGIRDGGWIEITEGLAAGDSVVTKAGSFVRDGDRINPIPESVAN